MRCAGEDEEAIPSRRVLDEEATALMRDLDEEATALVRAEDALQGLCFDEDVLSVENSWEGGIVFAGDGECPAIVDGEETTGECCGKVGKSLELEAILQPHIKRGFRHSSWLKFYVFPSHTKEGERIKFKLCGLRTRTRGNIQLSMGAPLSMLSKGSRSRVFRASMSPLASSG